MSDYILKKKFKDINLTDPVFDSLKEDYSGFPLWFGRKADEDAYVLYIDESISGFMYLKTEDEELSDVAPRLPHKKRIKIGTLKVDAHGTRVGERFVKKAIDYAISENVDEIYVTIFPKYNGLIELLNEFGFRKRCEKSTADGVEDVLIKNMRSLTGDLKEDYPRFPIGDRRKFLLSIYPKWHSQLFPDSILNNESYDVLMDVSHTNSIRKTYVCFMDLARLRAGDVLLIYRTKDDKGAAWYRSVVTSVCVVEEVRSRVSFENLSEFIDYTEPYSVFNAVELTSWWKRGSRLYVIKMLYSAAFSKRLIRKDLVEQFKLDPEGYWGFMELSNDQFINIIRCGGINERIVIN